MGISRVLSVQWTGGDDPLWLYILMPFISGAVGYVTNVVALKMTFFPLEFWGIKIWQPKDQPLGFIGWQGIVPSKAAKMAAKTVDLMTEKLIDIAEVFSRLDAAKMAEALEPGLLLFLDRTIKELANQFLPGTWSILPVEVRNEIVLKALESVPPFVDSLMTDVKGNITNLLDIRHMVVTNIEKDKSLLNNIFLEVGAKELKFIELSGIYFGFLFGIVQAVVFWFYKGSWVLPVGGFFVGFLTNYLALFMIFKPIQPRRLLGGAIYLHGLFLRRQPEVSEGFAKIIAKQTLHSKVMWESILSGPHAPRFNRLCSEHVHLFVDEMMGALKPLVLARLGGEDFFGITDDVSGRLLMYMPQLMAFAHEYINEALQVEATLCEAMQGLPYEEFEGVLHPVFEEDEAKLIFVGGVLGVVAGVLQLVFLF